MRRAAASLLAVLALAGCGLGPGDTPKDVRLIVTDDFGAREVVRVGSADVRGSDTVMRLLQRNAKVTTRYGGGFVQSIDGLAGGRPGGRPVDWFYYVNGSLAGKGAAATKVRPGDSVWWDRHDWGLTNDVRAVVGAFPEPFIHGPGGGERLPTRLECDEALEDACRTAAHRLAAAKVTVGRAKFPTEGATSSIRVLVGLWPLLKEDRAAGEIGRGTKASGVYARFDPPGRQLSLLDPTGRVVRTLGPGSGLVAATKYRDEPPTWVVTGTDAAGVQAAAQLLDERSLRNRFAVAVSGGRAIGVPVTRGGSG